MLNCEEAVLVENNNKFRQLNNFKLKIGDRDILFKNIFRSLDKHLTCSNHVKS